MTLEYEPNSNDPNQQYISDPDGLNASNLPSPPTSIVSIADVAFKPTTDASGNNYATLLVNLGGTLPTDTRAKLDRIRRYGAAAGSNSSDSRRQLLPLVD